MSAPRSLTILLVLVAAAYATGLAGDYVFDDRKLVVENRALAEAGGAWRIAGGAVVYDPLESGGNLIDPSYRPVRFVSWLADVRAWRAFAGIAGADTPWPPPSWVFHVSNLLHHLLACVLAFFIAERILGHRVWALVAALLWGLHPVQTEAVTYISGRRDVLCGLLVFASAGCFLRTRDGGKLRWLAGTLGFGLLALGAKEMAVMLGPALLLADLGLPRALHGRRHEHTRALALVLAAFGGAFLVYTLAVKDPGGGVRELLGVAGRGAGEGAAGGVGWWGGSPWTALLSACRAFWHYLGLLVFPWRLTVDYLGQAFPPSRSLFDPWTTPLAVLGCAAWAWVAVVQFRRGARRAGLALLLFPLCLAPVMQLLPHPERVGERFLYIPSLPLAILAAAGLRLCHERLDVRGGPSAAVMATGLVVLLLGARTAVRNLDWKDGLSLWGAAVRVRPGSPRAHLAFGKALRDAGRWPEALAQFDAAIAVLPPEAARSRLEKGLALNALYDRAQARVQTGDHRAAEQDLRVLLAATDILDRPIARERDFVYVHHALAAALWEQDRRDEAAAAWRAALAVDPDYAPAIFFLAQAASKAVDWTEAEALYSRLIALEPGHERARLERALVLGGMGRWDDAETELLGITERHPDDPNAFYLLSGLAHRQGRLDAQRRWLGQALERDPGHLASRFSLAELDFLQGRIAAAREGFEAILEKRPGHEPSRQYLAVIGLHEAGAMGEEGSNAGEGTDEEADWLLLKACNRMIVDGELDRAGGFAAEYIRRRPGEAVGYLAAADVARRKGDLGKAESILRKASSSFTDKPELILNLAAILALQERNDEAARLYRKFLDEEPGNPAAAKVRAWLEAHGD